MELGRGDIRRTEIKFKALIPNLSPKARNTFNLTTSQVPVESLLAAERESLGGLRQEWSWELQNTMKAAEA